MKMDQLFMFSNEYTMDDAEDAANSRNKKETKIKNEPADITDDGGDDDSYIMPGSLLQQMTSTPDADGEDDNTIFNFGIEATSEARQPTTTSKPYNSKHPLEINVNYDIAIMFICPSCGDEFKTQTAWKLHINGVHEYNTRRGLNFVPIDKLYHRCLECNKPIAMHAMENLLKHKFTHLPHRCTKCKICQRRYKYRQDLIVHLRLCHRREVLALTASANSKYHNQSDNNSPQTTPTSANARLAIMDIKGNAVDIFENTCDGVEVKNEPFDPDDPDGDNLLEQSTNKAKFATTSILENALGRSASKASDGRQDENENANERRCETHIQYICPVCNTEVTTKNEWLEHLQEMHNFCAKKGLGFKQISNVTVECMECKRVMPDKSIEQLQLHKFSHLPCKTWMRCKLCLRSFSNHKDIIKHLLNQHRFDDEYDADMVDESQDGVSYGLCSFLGTDNDENPDSAKDKAKSEIRDIYESKIVYICPKCGIEFFQRKMWRKHVVKEHNYNDLKTLCFVVLNEHQLQCRLCGKIITNAYGVQNAQQHYFTHLPHKAYIRCRMCIKSYTDRKGLVKHLRKVHHISSKTAAAAAAAISSKNTGSPPPAFQQVQKSSTQMSKVPPRTTPVKEIVRHNGVIYEIQFLDEENNDTSYAMMDGGSSGLCSSNDGFATPTKRHVCADCYSTFSTAQALQKHTKDQHDFKKPSQAHVCTMCFCTFESAGALQDHKFKHHGKNASSANENDDDDDDDKLLVPAGANDNARINDNSDNYVTQSNIDQYFCYLCPACGDEFKSQYEWRRHINDIHFFDRRYELNFRQMDKFHFQCLECKEVVNSAKLKGLQDHKFRHLPYKLYIKCRLCSTCYNHKPNMVTHLRIRHNLVEPNSSPSISPAPQMRFNASNYEISTPSPSPSQSQSTTKSFNTSFRPLTTEDIISNHNAVDHETITYRCPQCNEAFDTHALWRQHIVTEHDLNSRHGLNFRQLDAHHYICLECYKRVTVTHTKGAIGQLQSHKFRHLPYKSFVCTKCQGLFVRKQMFFKHLNRETNRCPLWGDEPSPNLNNKIKNSSMIMGRTMSTHYAHPSPRGKHLNFSVTSKEKCPYIIQCPQCGIKFEKWHPWREHIEKVHALHSMASLKFKKISDHLHICMQCKERVTGANFINLQTHRFKHLPYGTYLHCRYCDVRYYYMINIIKHMKQKHPFHGMEQLELQLESAGNEGAADLSPGTVGMEADTECDSKEGQDNDNTTNADNDNQLGDEHKAVLIEDDDDDGDNYGGDDDDKRAEKALAVRDIRDMEYGLGFGSESESESKINSYIIQCPQCGIKYDNWHLWREHIGEAHSLNDRQALNFTKIFDWLEECNECKDRVNATSFFILQTHKFKHLPYGNYLHCRYCDMKFSNMQHIVAHIKSKHPEQAVQQQHELSKTMGVVLPENENEMNEEEEDDEQNDKSNVAVVVKDGGDAKIDDDDEDDEGDVEEDDDDDVDDDGDVNENDEQNNGGAEVVGRMDVDDKSDDEFEDGEDEDEEENEDDDDDEDDDVVDDDDDDDDDDEGDDEIETYGNTENIEPAHEREITKNCGSRGSIVEANEEADESNEQFVLG